MNLFNEFIRNIKKKGLEYYGVYYGVYRGSVADNKDPDNLGRVKISVPSIYKDKVPNLWAYPRNIGMPGKGYGVFYVPQIGDHIYVSFENGDTRFPLYEAGWWTKGSVPKEAQTDGQENIIISTKDGRSIELNDSEEKIVVTDKSGYKIVLDKDGVFVGDGTNNLGAFLNDLFDIFAVTTSGPYPFNNIAQYEALKAKISNFLKTTE
jgi:hypothetical protein